MGLVDCGVGFHVRQVRKRSLMVALVCFVATLFAVLTRPYFSLFTLSAAVWSLAGRTVHSSVLVAFDRVAYRGRILSFANVSGVRAQGSRIVIDSAEGALVIDASLLDGSGRVTLVRHLEARMLFARSGRRCDRSERAAIEAFYVFGAHAVRMSGRRVAVVLDGDGSWAVSGRVYVRRGTHTTTYRTNARARVVEVDPLEMNLPAR